MAVNCDEGEPGTFKDRFYLEKDPHRFLEGMLIAAWVVEAADVYIYLRDEYPQIHAMLRAEIPKLETAGLNRATKIHLRRGEAINLTPATEYPVNLGMACPKGWEALNVLQSDDRAFHERQETQRQSQGQRQPDCHMHPVVRGEMNFRP